VLQWILGNSQIIEILPETSMKMAIMMENHLLCRAAFSILVSEEALSLTTRQLFSGGRGRGTINDLGRYREEIDDDILSYIEPASKSFNEKIEGGFLKLVDAEWLDDLPELQKLKDFHNAVSSKATYMHPSISTRWAAELLKFKDVVRDYVRGRIVYAAATEIP
jgi:hypothetical protein